MSPVALSSRPCRVSGLTHRTPKSLVSLFFSSHTLLLTFVSDHAPLRPADIINAVGFAVVIAYGVGMFFYDRRMKKKMADAALFANANVLPAVGSSLDEKDSASVDKLEVHDAQYENVVRA